MARTLRNQTNLPPHAPYPAGELPADKTASTVAATLMVAHVQCVPPPAAPVPGQLAQQSLKRLSKAVEIGPGAEQAHCNKQFQGVKAV